MRKGTGRFNIDGEIGLLNGRLFMIEILVEGITNNKGGKESYIVNSFTHFNKNKYHFTFIAYDEKVAYEDYLRDSGATIIHLPPRKNGLFNFRKSINDLFSKYRYDVLWSHKTTLSSCEMLEIAKRHKVPLRIVHSHSSSNMGGRLTFVLHCLNRLFIHKWANEYFACSEQAATWFFKGNSYTLVKNGIDIEKYRFDPIKREEIRGKLNVEKDLVVGHVGRFGVEKNHDKLIRVFNIVHNLKADTKLILCGDGEERKNIENQINELGLEDHVMLLGVINNVNDMLQAMDMIVMPSLFEGLPFALLEAQAAGLKCVVSDTVSKESDVLGWNTFLPLSSDDSVWANEIINMNIELEERYTAADRVKNAGYDICDCVHQVEEIIEKYIR